MHVNRANRLLCSFLNKYPDRITLQAMQSLTATEWDAVIRQSETHKVTPILYQRLKSHILAGVVPAAAAGRLKGIYLTNFARNVRLACRLSNLLVGLREEGILAIVLKGAHIAENVYPSPGWRTMTDVDLLFRRADLTEAMKFMSRKGYFAAGAELMLDIHVTLNPAFSSLNIDIEALMQRARPIRISGVLSMGLCPEDLLLHVILHLALPSPFRSSGLRTFCDMGEIIRRYKKELDWNTFCGLVDQWGARNAVCLTISLAERILGVRVPKDSGLTCDIESENPGLWKWAMNRIFDQCQEGPSLSPYFWTLWENESISRKISSLRNLVIPSPEYISLTYHSIPGSKRNYLDYIRRTTGHAARYGRAIRRIVGGDKKYLALLKRETETLQMQRWLTS